MAIQRGISPNFGVKEFATEEETAAFLKNLGFELLYKRSDYDVWQTRKEPRKCAVSLERERGGYLAKQLPFHYSYNGKCASLSMTP